ncbi:uncharacterized protein UV8b_05962 [Ustilaginoidea virens]|uniref:Uncharacterized protein n=1 Tax=Ustilaginoidea virens TaxID=1159556 RepID=A0A8E5HV02_USTVR|nr:uncharacterized protein UV8b_05962 [Ustilaginoidea virens]QUC21719.1 hypothetical protein UV8b_05962 [Ustilaginoidea virens]
MPSCFTGSTFSGYGATSGIPGQGYSYSTITSSVPSAPRRGAGNSCTGAMATLRRTSLNAQGRPVVDRRYSPPLRERVETNPPSRYASLPSGLAVPRAVLNKGPIRPDALSAGATRKPARRIVPPKPPPPTCEAAPGKPQERRAHGPRGYPRAEGVEVPEPPPTAQSSRPQAAKGGRRQESGASSSKAKPKSKSIWGCFS